MAAYAVALLSALLLFAAAVPAESKPSRSAQQRATFIKNTTCPATGVTGKRCPGYVVDHVKPLCAGGSDHWSNMQWQTLAEAKKKDRQEAAECRALRRKR
jgi:5-methylcytosine-specific restriction endonuclease McrA